MPSYPRLVPTVGLRRPSVALEVAIVGAPSGPRQTRTFEPPNWSSPLFLGVVAPIVSLMRDFDTMMRQRQRFERR
jgi:hypothetical protein